VNGASVLRPFQASRLASGGVAAIALAIAIAASVWHQQPALAQTATMTKTSAPVTTAQRDPSVPAASQVFAGSGLPEVPMVDAPTF
jgi:hypothetical protein